MNRILNLLHWFTRIVLGGIFIYTGYIKVKAPLQFAVALTGYQLLPENLIWPIAKYFPWAEIALGVALLIGWRIRFFSLAAVGLLAFFTALLTVTYLRGINANCGCFSFDDPISPKTILRDSLLLIPAVFLAVEAHVRARKGAHPPSASPNPAAES